MKWHIEANHIRLKKVMQMIDHDVSIDHHRLHLLHRLLDCFEVSASAERIVIWVTMPRAPEDEVAFVPSLHVVSCHVWGDFSSRGLMPKGAE